MKVVESTTKKYLITEIQSLDPVTVIVENFKLGEGQIFIQCFDKTWSKYWGAMGEQELEQFFISCDDCYLTEKLFGSQKSTEIDYDTINKLAAAKDLMEIGDLYSADAHETLEKLFGEEWHSSLPMKNTIDYDYLTRIVKVVKEAFKQIIRGK